MKVRCDEAMRRSKERTRSWQVYAIPKWKCPQDCRRCICGLVQDANGEWSHVAIRDKKGE